MNEPIVRTTELEHLNAHEKFKNLSPAAQEAVAFLMENLDLSVYVENEYDHCDPTLKIDVTATLCKTAQIASSSYTVKLTCLTQN